MQSMWVVIFHVMTRLDHWLYCPCYFMTQKIPFYLAHWSSLEPTLQLSNIMVNVQRKKYKAVLALHLLCVSFALLSWPITVRPRPPWWYSTTHINITCTRDISSSISYLFPASSGASSSQRTPNPSLWGFWSTSSASSSRSWPSGKLLLAVDNVVSYWPLPCPSACSGPVPPPASSASAPPWRSSTCWAGSSPAWWWSWTWGR